MTSRRKWINVFAIGFVSFLTTVSVHAEDKQPCFDLASLKGNYAIVGTYGANVAIALATRTMDGKGNLSGTFIVNEPVVGSPTGQRMIVSGTQAGTYTVNCDGTGVITRILMVNGTQTQQFDDFLITHAVMEDGHLIATGLADATRTPSAIVPGGIFLTRVWTRVLSPEGRPWGGQ